MCNAGSYTSILCAKENECIDLNMKYELMVVAFLLRVLLAKPLQLE
jgi:hypothetical protein